MAKKVRNKGKHWNPVELRELRLLAVRKTSIKVIAEKLGRSPASVQSKAISIGLRLSTKY